MQFLLLLLIIPSFALVGLQSYTSFGDSANAVAKVAGQSITQQELDAAQRQQMERMRQMFGDQFDAKMFDTPAAKQGVLDNLIAQRAQMAAVTREHLMVSDLTLQQTLLGIPELHGADGKFDNDKYRSLLAAQGTVPKIYEAGLRQDLALQQLAGAVQGTAFAPKSVALRFSNISDQEREIQELLFKTTDYAAQVKVTDDMLKAYYDKNSQQFEIPEQVKAEYVVLDMAAVAAQVTVSDADIKSYYDQNVAHYATPEQRRASHILITTKKDASAADKATAKAKAESLLAAVRKNPAEFAKLAKENSQDTASAEHGGDLGFFSEGMMVKPFTDAAQKLKEGQISNVVESDFGFHIIQLTGIKPASVKTLSQVRDEIAASIQKQMAAKKFAEMADLFNDTVYEQANSLKPAADKLKLAVQTVADLGRHPNPAIAPTAPYNNQKFLTALFADGAIKNKRNTAVIEAAPSVLIAGHVISYKPVTKQAFADVKESVRAKVMQATEAEFAVKAGEAKFAALKAKDDTAGFAAAKTVSRANRQSVSGNVFDAVMKADVSKLPAFVGVTLPGQGYAVYRIGKVAQPAAVDQARRQSEQQQIASALAQQEMTAYIDVLKKKAKAKILKPVVASIPVDANLASK
ncbi:peptidyl-prolyl cis-trans isomerase D [Glaciimonas immobilis]|uniref:Periplasmic chaperone PpiD n=2 Tax=Glaciimonas immobilis TaxID=728004 RepID=A0A840RN54_9BURK|nr:peptidyl-prolyl cis-trans isomerase D [Glaciimonas immobilis]